MGWFDSKSKRRSTKQKNTWVEVDDNGRFYHYIKSMLAGNNVEKFDPSKSFYFATHLAEIFIPFNEIAKRVTSVDYVLYDKSTDEPVKKVPESLQRLMNNPNPLVSGKELIYQIVFSELSSGGSYTLSKMPSSFKSRSYDRISNIWSLNPDYTFPKLYNQVPDPFLIKKLDELVEHFETHWIINQKLNPNEVYFNTTTKVDGVLCPHSPLIGVEKNINNLLAVYSARFNVYEKNGKAGIVFKDSPKAGDISEQVDPVTRQEILDDIENRDGITGDRNFTSISRYPLGFIETLGKIKDLEPFKETFADTIAIGAAFGVDKELLPKEESTTFSNKKDVEVHFWQNEIKPRAKEMAKTLTKAYYLPDNWEFRPIFDRIEVLQTDRKTNAEADQIELENIEKLNELGVNTQKHLEKWQS